MNENILEKSDEIEIDYKPEEIEIKKMKIIQFFI